MHSPPKNPQLDPYSTYQELREGRQYPGVPHLLHVAKVYKRDRRVKNQRMASYLPPMVSLDTSDVHLRKVMEGIGWETVGDNHRFEATSPLGDIVVVTEGTIEVREVTTETIRSTVFGHMRNHAALIERLEKAATSAEKEAEMDDAGGRGLVWYRVMHMVTHLLESAELFHKLEALLITNQVFHREIFLDPHEGSNPTKLLGHFSEELAIADTLEEALYLKEYLP